MIEDRKKYIINILKKTESPISASKLGRDLGVSRQVIVNDIALLRATGEKIIATPKGYVIEQEKNPKYVIACKHGKADMEKELMAIIDCGCAVLDVIVEHDIYGQISANLRLYTRKDVLDFIEKANNCDVQILCSVTNNYHFHTLYCPTDKHFEDVKQTLKEMNISL